MTVLVSAAAGAAGAAMKKILMDLLDCLAKRPQIYLPSMSYERVRIFLFGLRIGCGIAGLMYTSEDYCAAARARGWDPRSNTGIDRDFTRKGISDEMMAQEFLAVEIDAYRRALARLPQEKSNE